MAANPDKPFKIPRITAEIEDNPAVQFDGSAMAQSRIHGQVLIVCQQSKLTVCLQATYNHTAESDLHC